MQKFADIIARIAIVISVMSILILLIAGIIPPYENINYARIFFGLIVSTLLVIISLGKPMVDD
jgi:hypothetical protein